jgi:hypothetical protein
MDYLKQAREFYMQELDFMEEAVKKSKKKETRECLKKPSIQFECMLRDMARSVGGNVSLLIGAAELDDQDDGTWTLMVKWKMEFMLDKGEDCMTRNWISNIITLNEFWQAEGLFSVLPRFYREDT